MKLLHLEHVEDYLLTGNMIQSVDVLYALCDALTGRQSLHTKITTKYDGAPAIVFGVNPENHQFFIGTKSVFNKVKDKKICYSEADIETHFGSDESLVKKLTCALSALRFEHMNAAIPLGIYQGDLLWTFDSKVKDDRTISFCSNTITYKAERESAIGIDVAARHLGLVVHTQYHGDTMDELHANLDVDQATFWNSAVVFVDPTLRIEEYGIEQIEYNTCLDSFSYVEKTFRSIPDRSLYDRHGKFLKMFINQCVRIGEDNPESNMYSKFLRGRNELVLAMEVDAKHSVFGAIFSMHRHLVHSKKIILKSLNRGNKDFFTEVAGKPTDGEGYVVTFHGVPCKLVNRFEFSRLNFANKRFAKAA